MMLLKTHTFDQVQIFPLMSLHLPTSANNERLAIIDSQTFGLRLSLLVQFESLKRITKNTDLVVFVLCSFTYFNKRLCS